MTITIDPKLEARIREKAEAEGLTVEAYVERLVSADQIAEIHIANGPSLHPCAVPARPWQSIEPDSLDVHTHTLRRGNAPLHVGAAKRVGSDQSSDIRYARDGGVLRDWVASR